MAELGNKSSDQNKKEEPMSFDPQTGELKNLNLKSNRQRTDLIQGMIYSNNKTFGRPQQLPDLKGN